MHKTGPAGFGEHSAEAYRTVPLFSRCLMPNNANGVRRNKLPQTRYKVCNSLRHRREYRQAATHVATACPLIPRGEQTSTFHSSRGRECWFPVPFPAPVGS